MNKEQTPILKIKDLSKTFLAQNKNDSTDVINNISLEAYKGEIISIVGPSGCGKSTLLNIVAGFDKQYKGEVLYKDKTIESPSSEIGVVFQSSALFDWLNIRDNIRYGLKISKVNKKEINESVKKYIELIGLEEFESFYPNQLSGGMKQRVALARALIMKPDMLLMDEPFSALDYQSRIEMQSLTLKLWEVHKPTILLITHDVEEAIMLSDRVVVLSKRPGVILKEFDVPFKRPRNIDILGKKEFGELKIEVLNMLF